MSPQTTIEDYIQELKTQIENLKKYTAFLSEEVNKYGSLGASILWLQATDETVAEGARLRQLISKQDSKLIDIEENELP